MSEDSEYTFDYVVKDPAKGLTVKLEFGMSDECAVFREPNEQVALNEYCRPKKPNGFAYRCTTAGTTGLKEPLWPTTATLTVRDGSAVWTAVSAGTYAINAISSPTAVSDPTGLTISSVSVDESTAILATYEGGTEDEDYDAVFTFTMGGTTRVARQTVKVRKQ